MSGRLISKTNFFEIPQAGDPVLIIVNSVNKPTGMWVGRMEQISLKKNEEGVVQLNHTGDHFWCKCEAVIADRRAPSDWLPCVPSVDYDVYIGAEALNKVFEEKARVDAEKNAEIRALKNKLATVTDTAERFMASIASKFATEIVNQVFDKFSEVFKK